MADAKVTSHSVEDRAKIEARRGIVRDAEGKIIRTPEWLDARVEMLKEKKADLLNRIDNIDAEINERKTQSKNAKKDLAKAGK